MNNQPVNQIFDVLIIGGGPSGLMAATELIEYDCSICLIEAMPTIGRKFLMAGKSGLNITTSKKNFVAEYGESARWILPLIKKYGPKEIIKLCESLGQTLFIGSSGKVFPKVMKSSPLLRSWLVRLTDAGVVIRTSSRWVDLNQVYKKDAVQGTSKQFVHEITSNGKSYLIQARATILALGGASWSKLGSDGKWKNILKRHFFDSKKSLIPFAPSNMGIIIPWSNHMLKFEGHPVKSIAIKVNGKTKKGEFVVTRNGVEGGIIYLFSTTELGTPKELEIDLLPNFSILQICKKLEREQRKLSISNFLRKSLGLKGVKFGLLCEYAFPFPKVNLEFAMAIKNLKIKVKGGYPMDYAISTRGGIAKEAVNQDLMLNDLPGIFCAGEMLDWTAPTGGFLLTGCFSTGSRAGKSVARYLSLKLPS